MKTIDIKIMKTIDIKNIKEPVSRSNPSPSPLERAGVRLQGWGEAAGLCVMRLYLLLLSFFFAACEKDGDKIYLSGLEASEFMVSETSVALSKETSAGIVLSVAWSSNTPVISDPNMSAPNVFAAYIQLSTREDFSSNVVETQGENGSKAYTGAELNTVAKNLGMEPGVAAPVYFRLRGSMGSNIASVYSEVKTVHITPYFIDMTIGNILDSNKTATGITLSSPEADGIYAGFVGAASWFNFYLEEGDGRVWGNDAVTETPFVASSEAGSWNFWYPEPGGCYYTEVNTVAKHWSAVYLPVLSVSGDLSGDLTYDRPNNRWRYVFNAAAAGAITLQLSGQGDLYNKDTGDSAPAAGKVTIAFTQDGDNLALASAAGNVTVNIPAAGESTLIVDLSDPKAWTCNIVSGSEEPDAVTGELFLIGIDDGVSGSWNFNTRLKLYDEDGRKYAGVANVNSLWGYQIAIENDNWTDVYTMASGDAYAGTLEFQGETNIAAPAPGLYFFDVSPATLTYTLTAVGNEIYLSGLNNTWDFSTTLQATATPGVYSGSITITTVSEWGFKIYLIADNWDHVYGGGGGALYYGGNGITDDAALGVGTYTMTVDLINGTYTIQ